MRINVWRNWTGKPCFRDKVTGACEATLPSSNSNDFSFFLYHPPTELWESNIFNRACLSLSTWGDPHVTITHDVLGLTVQDPLALPPYWISDLGPLAPDSPLLTSGGQHCGDLFKLVHLRIPQEATSGGGHWSTYHFQAGGMHPTGMFSCYSCTSVQSKDECDNWKPFHYGLSDLPSTDWTNHVPYCTW